MKTATETINEMTEQRDENQLNLAIRDFIKRFEPEDRRDRLDFEMHLHSIVRQIYRDAQKPFHKALETSMTLTPPVPFFVPKQ